MAKPSLALYWAASCGGCEIAVLDLQAKILDVAGFFDIVFWPCAMDFKYADVRALPDRSITLTLFNGAVRNSESFEIARLLRQKSVLLCAFGSCATTGGIPGLANLNSAGEILDYVYEGSPSVHNPERTRPQTSCEVPAGTLHLPHFWESVRTLDQVVDVDYLVPGCPPQPERIAAVVDAVMDILSNGKPLPPKGTVLGAATRACCEECERKKDVKKIRRFVRPHEVVLDPEICLLEQGVICMGPATRAGCGSLCVKAGLPCRGCYGPPAGVRDQGAKMVSALASVIDSDDPDEVARIVAGITDLAGTVYRFSLPQSSLRRNLG